MSKLFWQPCICTYYSLGCSSSLCFHIYIKQVFSWRGSFVNCLQITDDMKEYINSKDSIWIGQLSVKSSIWIGILFKRHVYIWVYFKILAHTPVSKLPWLPPPPPPPPMRKVYCWCWYNYLSEWKSSTISQ